MPVAGGETRVPNHAGSGTGHAVTGKRLYLNFAERTGPFTRIDVTTGQYIRTVDGLSGTISHTNARMQKGDRKGGRPLADSGQLAK